MLFHVCSLFSHSYFHKFLSVGDILMIWSFRNPLMKLDSKHRSHTLFLTEVCFLGGFRHGTGQSPCAEDFPLQHTSTGRTGPYICSFQDDVAFLQHRLVPLYDCFQPGVVEPFAWWLQVRMFFSRFEEKWFENRVDVDICRYFSVLFEGYS